MAEAGGAAPHRVVMLGFPDAQILDITGPLEVFARTGRWLRDHCGRGPAYVTELVAERPGPLRTSGGLELTATRAYEEIDSADTLLVAGGIGQAAAGRDPRLLDWLRRAGPASGRFGSICTGSLILAAAGLLSGRRATTHWGSLAALQDLAPDCEVARDAIYVRDGTLYTSAGVTAGMDMALGLVEEDWGRTVALRVAQELVMFLVRPGGQPQLSSHLRAQQREGGFGALELWILDHLEEELTVERLAAAAGMSARNFTRRFAREMGQPPSAYVGRLRVERAMAMLEAAPGMMLKEVARRCGFGSEQNLRRGFLRALGVPPETYRARLPERRTAA